MTDIQSSTSRWESDREAMNEAVLLHEKIAQDVVSRSGGEVLKARGEGDSLFCVFRSAKGAVQASSELHRRFAETTWPTVEPIRVRAAVHMGEVYERDGDFFGSTISRCARIRGLAEGGVTLLSESVKLQVQDDLPEGLELQDLGLHRLKDLMRAERIFAVHYPGSPLPSLLPSLDIVTPNNLPVQVTSFVGREQELKDIARLLASNRLVTLLGTGGIGKTRLALQTAADVANQYPDGVWFIDLAPVRPDTSLESVFCSTLRTELPLHDFLANKKMLLLVDNCEHLVNQVAKLISEIMRENPGVKLFTTSRELIRVKGEAAYTVPTLESPSEDFSGNSIDALAYSAVHLFVDRISERNQHFDLQAAGVQLVSELCRHLDGLPLAIEQAAAQSAFSSPADVLSRLSNRFRVLKSDYREGGVPRHVTMRTVIDWSVNLLSESERLFFARLSVFEGSWTIEQAEMVCSSEPIEEGEGYDLLRSLVEKSLVVREECAHCRPRFRFLETIRAYSESLLSAERDRFKQIHAQTFLQVAKDAERHLVGPEQVDCLVQIEEDMANLRAARSWWQETEPARCLELSVALRRFFTRRSVAEGIQWLKADLECGSEANPEVQVTGWNALGALAIKQDDYTTAREAFERVLSYANEESPFWTAALTNLGIVASRQGARQEARRFMEQGLEAFRRRGDDIGLAQASLNLANLHIEESEPERAIDLLQTSVLLFDRLGEVSLLGKAHLDLASAYRSMGKNHEQLENLATALYLFDQVQDYPNLGNAALQLASLASSMEQYDEAARILGAARETLKHTGASFSSDQQTEAQALESILVERLGKSQCERELRAGTQIGLSSRAGYFRQMCRLYDPNPAICT